MENQIWLITKTVRHPKSRTRSLCLSLSCCMSHSWCTAWSWCKFDFLSGWANSQSAPSQRGLFGIVGQWSVCDGVKVLVFFFPLFLHSWALVCVTFCLAESHRSSQLSRSAQWTSPFEIFHFTLCCQAPCWWVTRAQPNYSQGLRVLYLTLSKTSVQRKLFCTLLWFQVWKLALSLKVFWEATSLKLWGWSWNMPWTSSSSSMKVREGNSIDV